MLNFEQRHEEFMTSPGEQIIRYAIQEGYSLPMTPKAAITFMHAFSGNMRLAFETQINAEDIDDGFLGHEEANASVWEQLQRMHDIAEGPTLERELAEQRLHGQLNNFKGEAYGAYMKVENDTGKALEANTEDIASLLNELKESAEFYGDPKIVNEPEAAETFRSVAIAFIALIESGSSGQ
jgi:hypothetical protein